MTHNDDIAVYQLRVGACFHFERLARTDGQWEKIEFPALCGLIRHPVSGWILYDTGYSSYFMEKTRYLPNRLHRTLLSVALNDEDLLEKQLKSRGVSKDDIGLVLISHFHCDHIAGLRDFKNAQFMVFRSDLERAMLTMKRPWKSLTVGFMPDLLPDDFLHRIIFADEKANMNLPVWMAPFESGFDLMGDGSMFAVPLPGHSCGQMGLLLPKTRKGPVFLVSDSCWSMDACKKKILPARLAEISMTSKAEYVQTFQKIGQLANREKDLWCLPSHCLPSWKAYCHESN